MILWISDRGRFDMISKSFCLEDGDEEEDGIFDVIGN